MGLSKSVMQQARSRWRLLESEALSRPTREECSRCRFAQNRDLIACRGVQKRSGFTLSAVAMLSIAVSIVAAFRCVATTPRGSRHSGAALLRDTMDDAQCQRGPTPHRPAASARRWMLRARMTSFADLAWVQRRSKTRTAHIPTNLLTYDNTRMHACM